MSKYVNGTTLPDLLAEHFRYRTLPKIKTFQIKDEILTREMVYRYYRELVDEFSERYNVSGEDVTCELKLEGGLILSGYKRIVVGDYGAYIEFNKEQLHYPLVCPNEQLWRFDKAYLERRDLHIKYYYYTLVLKNRYKIYLQIDGVKYADYRPGMYYIALSHFL